MKASCLTWLLRKIMWLAPGATMLGASCAAEIQNSLKTAGLDFLQDSATKTLETLIPIAEVLGGK